MTKSFYQVKLILYLPGNKFMSNPGIGGRGKNAPYKTVHYRIPEPLKPVVERFAAAYRILVGSGIQENCDQLLQNVDSALVKTFEGEKHQITIHEAIIEKLQLDLAESQKQVTTLENKQKLITELLESTLSYKAQQGTKIQSIIRQALKVIESM